MTQQEYKSIKQSYWNGLIRDMADRELDPYTAFSFAFDRAYSIGKQTETITQEEIEKAAVEYSEHLGKSRDVTWNDAEYGFIAGAKFALGKQEKDADTVIQGWVFVDETTFDHHLCIRKVTQGDYEAVWYSGHPEFCLGEELFPDMVPNKLPEPVEIIIKRKNK